MPRLSLDVSDEVNDVLESLASKMHGTKSDVLRKAIALMQVAVTAKEEGKKFGVADSDNTLTTEVIGL
jgi:predicted transcriptional regulator